MASCAKEDMGESSCAESDSSLSQPPQAELLGAAEDSQCPICLGHVKSPAYAAYCMHKFCFWCIQKWARKRDSCPVCRQPMEKLLYCMQEDGSYKEHEVCSFTRLRRMSMWWIPSAATLQLEQAAHDPQPLVGRRGPLGPQDVYRQEDAPGPSNVPAQQAPASSASDETAPWRARECPDGPAAPLDPHRGNK